MYRCIEIHGAGEEDLRREGPVLSSRALPHGNIRKMMQSKETRQKRSNVWEMRLHELSSYCDVFKLVYITCFVMWGLRLSIPASSFLLDSGLKGPLRERAKHTELRRAGAFFPVERHSSLLSSPWLWQHFFLAKTNFILLSPPIFTKQVS